MKVDISKPIVGCINVLLFSSRASCSFILVAMVFSVGVMFSNPDSTE